VTGTEWALLLLALSGLAFLFVLSLCVAAAAEDRRLEREARRRYMDARRHPAGRGGFRDLPNDGWGRAPRRGDR
jgi:hypothetical protein